MSRRAVAGEKPRHDRAPSRLGGSPRSRRADCTRPPSPQPWRSKGGDAAFEGLSRTLHRSLSCGAGPCCLDPPSVGEVLLRIRRDASLRDRIRSRVRVYRFTRSWRVSCKALRVAFARIWTEIALQPP